MHGPCDGKRSLKADGKLHALRDLTSAGGRKKAEITVGSPRLLGIPRRG